MKVNLSGPVAAMVLSASLAVAQSSGRPGYGLIGYPITMYQPACAFACRSSLPLSSVPCDSHLHGHHSSSVSPECLANSEAYLLSAAWCFHTRCTEEEAPVSRLELFWEQDLVGRELDQPSPKWTYQESLARALDDPPTATLEEDAEFDSPILTDDEGYLAAWNGNSAFEHTEVDHQRFSLIILGTGVGIPVALSLLRFIPFPAALVGRFYAWFIEPPVFTKHHAVPVLGLGLVPTRGQALFIFYIIAINVIFAAAGYQSRQPNSWWALGQYEEITNYVANRTGMLSFANLPLVFLYSGRNNLLLWLTNWSHSTFLLLHRWVAFICMLQAVIHSAIWLHIHVSFQKDHSEVAIIPYWYWGIIATLALVLLVPFSLLPVRKRMYEFFHAAHIVLAVLSLVGCWYHIVYRYKRQWGYENWVIMASVIWGFEWVLRALRLARNGVKRGIVTKVGDDYLRIDVPNADCHGHAYVYFPTLSWRFWESHPFSATGYYRQTTTTTTISQVHVRAAPDKTDGAQSSSASSQGTPSVESTGVTFFVRIATGATSQLAKYHGTGTGVPLLLEAYSGESRLYDGEGRSAPCADFPNVLAIAGGVGITALLPKLSAHDGLHAPAGSKKLYWGVRNEARGLVQEVQSLVAASQGVDDKAEIRPEGSSSLQWGEVEVEVSVGPRFDLRAVIESEVLAKPKGTLVLVCGPPGMSDEVRNVVSALGRNGAVVRLVEESFMW